MKEKIITYKVSSRPASLPPVKKVIGIRTLLSERDHYGFTYSLTDRMVRQSHYSSFGGENGNSVRAARQDFGVMFSRIFERGMHAVAADSDGKNSFPVVKADRVLLCCNNGGRYG